MEKYCGVDFLRFDSLLSDEEKIIRNTVREFTEEQVLLIIAWGGIGSAMACYEEAGNYAAERDSVRQTGRFVPDYPGKIGCYVDRDHKNAVYHAANLGEHVWLNIE